MNLVRPGGFERALRGLDRDALAAFVADLWDAGGWETSVEGAVVVAERAGRRRRIRVVAAGRGPGWLRRRGSALAARGLGVADLVVADLGDADVVVDATGSGRVAAAARSADAEYVSPAALRDRLLYGVPRDVGAALSEQHLSRPLTAVRGSGGDHRIAAPQRLLLGAVVAVLVVGAVVVVAGPYGPPFGGPAPPTAPPAAGGAAVDGSTPSGTPSPAAAELPEGTGTVSADGPSFPPGLSARGVENASALADAHVAATKNHRYAVAVSFDGPAVATGFEDFTSVRWSARIESRRHFLVNATYRRAGDGGPLWQHRGVYADGVTTFRRTTTREGTQYAAVPAGTSDARAYLHVATSLIERYLDTGVSIVRRAESPEGPRFHVAATGTPDGLADSAADYWAEALVTPEGRVTMLAVRYTLAVDGEQRQVRIRFDYGEFGTARVEPPDWYDEARNETGG